MAEKKETKMVTVRLFKDSGKYKSPVFVGVNGRTWQIQRGENVQVPDYVADILEQSLDQDSKTAMFIDRKVAEGKEAEKALG